MERIRKILLIFSLDTFIVLISWAGLSLIAFCVRAFSTVPTILMKMLSIYPFFIIMFGYAFYLILDLCEYLSTELRIEK
jgi:signal transduction histidine kinase